MKSEIICGESLEVLSAMESESIDMAITSPPYWGLRDYGVENQLGLEKTPEEYIERLATIFRELKRVLKKEGTFWLNVGDSYSGSGGDHKESHSYKGTGFQGKIIRGVQVKKLATLKAKCLCMIPERLAWRMVEDGWILRNKIVWFKRNAMPASVKDRLTNKWEYLFLFTRARVYHFDLDSIREPHSFNRWSMSNPIGSKRAKEAAPGQSQHSWQRKGHSGYYDGEGNLIVHPLGKNPGDHWDIPTHILTGSFSKTHVAIFPERLCEQPIKAGCPKDGVVLDPFCGAGTAGVVAKKLGRQFIGIDLKPEYCEMAKKRIAKVGYQKELFDSETEDSGSNKSK